MGIQNSKMYTIQRQVLDLKTMDSLQIRELLGAMTPRQRQKINWVNYDGVEWRWTGKLVPHMFRKGFTAKQFVPVVAQLVRKQLVHKHAQLLIGIEQPDFGTRGWWM